MLNTEVLCEGSRGESQHLLHTAQMLLLGEVGAPCGRLGGWLLM